MSKEKIFLLIFLLVSTFSSAQVGINTKTPVEALDINGDLQIRNGIIKLGKSGDPGRSGDYMMSYGPDKSSIWIGLDESSFDRLYLAHTESKIDTIGVVLYDNSSAIGYTEDLEIDYYKPEYGTTPSNTGSYWYPFNQLTLSDFEIPALDSDPSIARKHLLSIEGRTVFQYKMQYEGKPVINSSGGISYIQRGWMSFALGVAVDGKLKAVRMIQIDNDMDNPFAEFNIKCLLSDLTPGPHKIELIAARRNRYYASLSATDSRWSDYLAVSGRAWLRDDSADDSVTLLRDFMANATMSVSLYLRVGDK